MIFNIVQGKIEYFTFEINSISNKANYISDKSMSHFLYRNNHSYMLARVYMLSSVFQRVVIQRNLIISR